MPRYHKPYTLYQRPMQDGVTVWYYRTYTHAGKRIAKSTGLTNQTDARRYCDRLLREGKLVSVDFPTLELWARERHWWHWGSCLYCEGILRRSAPTKPRISQRYADSALRILEKRILPAHSSKLLNQITVDDCERLLFSWLEQGAAPKTANNWRMIYRTMLSEAVRLELLSKNPWSKVKPLGVADRPRVLLTLEEVRRLLDPRTVDVLWQGWHMMYVLNLLAALTACRRGERLALQVADVRADHIHVAHSYTFGYGLLPTKGRTVNDIPIPQFARIELSRFLTGEGYVFSTDGGVTPIYGNAATYALYGALKSIGIDESERQRRNLTFHSWRHWAKSRWRSRGVPDAKIRAVTRHRMEKMTDLYTTFRLEDFREIAEEQEALAQSLVSIPAPARGAT